MDDVKGILAASPLFAGLEDDALASIGARFTPVSVGAGEIVCREGDEGDCMYIVGSGAVRVLKRMGRAERELARMGPGEYFGEMALITQDHRAATIAAVDSTTLARLDLEGFNALMEEDARFAQRILKVIASRLRVSDEVATQDMLKAHQALIFSLAKLADQRDPETGAHLYRVRDYSALLAELLREHPRFKDDIDEAFIEAIYLTSPLHDIGKVAIPDGILLKAGRLTEMEFQIMSSHTTIGAEAFKTVTKFCDFEPFEMARRIIHCHHERYDGTGYPRGLVGEEIPLEARIMTLADIYDALLSERVYKPAFSYGDASKAIEDGAGKHFDPDMAEVMLDHIGEFQEIHKRYEEEGTPEW